MVAVILDNDLVREMRLERKESGADRWDEVWDGVYVFGVLADNEHQAIVGKLTTLLTSVLDISGRGQVRPGVNVSDRREDWTQNYRCPDVVVYLPGGPAENCGTHWLGGPDLAIEVVSPGEVPYAERIFYAKVNTRELLVIDRDPWRLELFRVAEAELRRVGVSEVTGGSAGAVLASEVVPFTWRILPGTDRPRIEIVGTEDGRTWYA